MLTSENGLDLFLTAELVLYSGQRLQHRAANAGLRMYMEKLTAALASRAFTNNSEQKSDRLFAMSSRKASRSR